MVGTLSRPKFGRNTSTFHVGSRPKAILVTGLECVPEAVAVAVFRDTRRMAKVEDGWLVDF